jgi:hypothetical protein
MFARLNIVPGGRRTNVSEDAEKRDLRNEAENGSHECSLKIKELEGRTAKTV